MTQQAQRETGEPHAGKQLGSAEFAVTDEMMANYFEGLELDPKECGEGSPFGRPVVPSMIATSSDNAFTGRGGFSNAFGNLWMRQQWKLHQPLVPGESYQCSARIVDIYEKRDRTVVDTETTVLGPGGEVMAVARHHQSYLLGQTSGEVQLRDAKAKEGSRRFDVPGGEPIEPVDRTITLEMCGTFFHGAANYHTDKKAAEELGFRDVVVGGRMTLSYVGELMERRFGTGWWQGGTLDLKFTNIVWPGDHVTAKAVITDRESENGGTRAHVFAWMEKDDGTVAIVASASALE